MKLNAFVSSLHAIKSAPKEMYIYRIVQADVSIISYPTQQSILIRNSPLNNTTLSSLPSVTHQLGSKKEERQRYDNQSNNLLDILAKAHFMC